MVEAVEYPRHIQLSVHRLDFRDVRNAFLQRPIRMEVALQKIVRLAGLPIRLRDAIGFSLGLVADPQDFHHAVDRALAGDVEPLRMLLQEQDSFGAILSTSGIIMKRQALSGGLTV